MANPTSLIGLSRLHLALIAGGVAIESVNSAGIVTPTSLQAAAAPIIAAFDPSPAADAAYLSAQAHTVSSGLFISGLGGLTLRAIASVLVDELNLLRQRDRDRAIDVAASTSLADLKTRWAARSDLADRTLSQAKTALQNAITSGTAD